MDLKTLRIIYMGTPGFAVAPLKKLIDGGCNVVAVITAPDKPAGRGQQIRISAVKAALQEAPHPIPILQPANLKDPDFLEKIKSFQPDLQVVVAFRMLPEPVWKVPRLGTFNLHASLLPQYRGAAPINHAIMNGETETGVTTFLIDEQIDTGRILLQEKTAIGNHESAGELHDRLMTLGALLVLETVEKFASGALQPLSQGKFIQPHSKLHPAPKIFKEDCRINWERTGLEVYNQIRGLSPYPAAFTCLEKPGGVRLNCKIYVSKFESSDPQARPGTILTDGKSYLKVAVKDGTIELLSLQLEGKRRMDISDFLPGLKWSSGTYRFS